MSYTSWKDGYKKETTPGTSVVTDPAHDCNLWGAHFDPAKHPTVTAPVKSTAPGVNAKEIGANLMFRVRRDLSGNYGIVPQNGVFLWAALGKSSTAGAGPYTHTITPTTDGTDIPSFTINHMDIGSATNEEYQWTGCKIDSVTLQHDMAKNPFLMADINWMAMKAQDGQALTNSPALPATANTNPYVNLTRTWDSTGTPLSIDGLQRLSIVIANGLNPLFANSYDTGTYTGMWPWRLHEAPTKEYRIIMDMHPNTIERKIWDAAVGTDAEYTCVFKWTRSANDYIQVTAVCYVESCEKIGQTPEQVKIEQAVLVPRTMSIEVKDSIAGSAYGE